MANRKLIEALTICSVAVLTGCSAPTGTTATDAGTAQSEITQTEDTQTDSSGKMRLSDAEEIAGFELEVNLRTTSEENDLTGYFTANRVYTAESGKISIAYNADDGSEILSVTKAKGDAELSGDKKEDESTGRGYYIETTDDAKTCSWNLAGYSYKVQASADIDDDTLITLANKVDYDETRQEGKGSSLISIDHEAVTTFSMTSVDGEEIDFLSAINESDKPTVLFIGAQWCQDCRREMAVLQKEMDEYQDSMQWYYVTFARDDENEKTVKHDTEWYMEENGYDIPVYYASYSELTDKYSVSAIPTILFIDENKEIVGKVIEDSYNGIGIYDGMKLLAGSSEAK